MVPYTFSVFLFSFNLAQHCLFFLLLIESSSKDVRRTLIGSETFVFFKNVMKPKFLLLLVLIERFPRKFGHHTARQNTAQAGGCKKRTFGRHASSSKRLCLSSLLKCWIISCRTLYLHFSFLLDLPNLLQGQGAWFRGILFTRVFILSRFSWPSCHAIYSVISTLTHSHLVSTDLLPEKCVKNIQPCMLPVKGGTGW